MKEKEESLNALKIDLQTHFENKNRNMSTLQDDKAKLSVLFEDKAREASQMVEQLNRYSQECKSKDELLEQA